MIDVPDEATIKRVREAMDSQRRITRVVVQHRSDDCMHLTVYGEETVTVQEPVYEFCSSYPVYVSRTVQETHSYQELLTNEQFEWWKTYYADVLEIT